MTGLVCRAHTGRYLAVDHVSAGEVQKNLYLSSV